MKTRDKFIYFLGNHKIATIIALSIVVFDPQVGLAQVKQTQEKSRQNLEKIENQLNQSRQREDELSQRRVKFDEEAARLSAQLIASAARLQAREAQATATEFRLARLTVKEGEINKRLVLERDKLAELLAGLQRIERFPPPALVVRPENALDAIRSAMLLGTLIPEIKQEANALAGELRNLQNLRQEIASEQSDLNQTAVKLEVERLEIEKLLKIKRTASLETNQEIEIERERMASLGEQAKSLKDLLWKLRQQKDKSKTKNATVPQIKLARLTPAIRFSKNRRALSFPVQGERVRNYGDADGFGGIVRGLSIASRSRAQVISPNDGTIVYAGKFRGYGELLIINAGEGYHVLLAGMERITTEVGQFVLAGEPIGSMGSSATRGAALGARNGDDRPVLYIEFRRNGTSLDPTPWWVGNVKKARG